MDKDAAILELYEVLFETLQDLRKAHVRMQPTSYATAKNADNVLDKYRQWIFDNRPQKEENE